MVRIVKIVLMQILLFVVPVLVFAGPMPDTGQTKCYDNSVEIPCPNSGEPFYGQDAQYSGPARSYTKLGQNGVELPDTATQAEGWIMTRDNVTGLIWEIKTDDESIHDKDNTYTWYDSNPATNGGNAGTPGDGTDTEDFINVLNAQHFGGFADWRMPTVKELSSLIDSSTNYPAIDTAWFPRTVIQHYWSSTTCADNTNKAWPIDCSNGFVRYNTSFNDKSYSDCVRAVRGNQLTNNFVDNGDGTVTDTETGLMWQKATAPGTYTWEEALAYAEGLELPVGGYTDWRLPNRNELQTLVDYSQYDPSVDPLLKTSVLSGGYWTSTTYGTQEAWRIALNHGYVSGYDKSLSYSVIAARDNDTTKDTIDFSGYTWRVKHSPDRMGPGNNLWSNSTNDVWVDKEGLHLKISKHEDNNWYCTEIYTEKSFGYGTYIFYLATELEDRFVGANNPLDNNVVLGLFTWDNNTCENNANSEIDIELARWPIINNPDGPDNPEGNDKILNYSVQPTGGTGTGYGCPTRNNITDGNIIPMELTGDYTTHVFKWMPNSVQFDSYHGHGNPTAYPIGSWEYNDNSNNCRKTETCGDTSVMVGIPKATKDTKVHINFWLFDTDNNGEGNPPSNGLEQNVIIRKFEYIPVGQIPDTGQTKCYNTGGDEIPCPQPGEAFYGQDAQYEGPARSYTKLGQNGVELPDTATQAEGWIMTRDNVTGLIWEIKTDDGTIHDKDNAYTWYDSNPATNGGYAGTPGNSTDTEDFINALNAQHFGGFADWRMPTIKELSSLVNSSIADPGPAIDTARFSHTMSSGYWSSTTIAGNTYYAWLVSFNGGYVNNYNKSNSYYVRAVRGSRLTSNLIDNKDGTVTDTETGLMWQKATAPGTYTWQQALAYAEGLELPTGGYTDWRLPNRNELQTLVDYSINIPAIDPILQTNTLPYSYWSSTTLASITGRAWRVGFHGGNVYDYGKSDSYYVRAVRAGQSGPFGNLAMPWIPLLLLDE